MFGLFDQYSETAQATVLGAKLLNYRATGEHARPKYEFLLEVKPAPSSTIQKITRYSLSSREMYVTT